LVGPKEIKRMGAGAESDLSPLGTESPDLEPHPNRPEFPNPTAIGAPAYAYGRHIAWAILGW
jgi:hypothetical protein